MNLFIGLEEWETVQHVHLAAKNKKNKEILGAKWVQAHVPLSYVPLWFRLALFSFLCVGVAKSKISILGERRKGGGGVSQP